MHSGVVQGSLSRTSLDAAKRLGVRDDGPDLLFSELGAECRHLRTAAPVPDFVEDDAVRVLFDPLRVREIHFSRHIRIRIGAIAESAGAVASRAFVFIDGHAGRHELLVNRVGIFLLFGVRRENPSGRLCLRRDTVHHAENHRTAAHSCCQPYPSRTIHVRTLSPKPCRFDGCK